jgi:PEGA domain-containing protein
MDSQPFDQSRDPLLAFASEASVAPTADREPAFLRIPTPYDGHLSITSVAEQAPSQTDRGGLVTTVLVIAGVVAGFAGGYVFADRIIPPAAAPAQRVAAPAPAAAPAPVPAPVAAPVASSEPVPLRTEPSTEPPREPDAVAKTAQAADAKVASVPSARPTTKRASIPSSTTRPSPTTRPRPAVAPITPLGGAIEIVSRPRDAKVFLDGSFVGQAPLSIPDVSEGAHEVRVELDGFSPWAASVRVKGGSRARVGASLEHK